MGDFQADTLRDSIEAGWSLTDQLSKAGSTTMQNPVEFFAHDQVKDIELRKAVVVKKTTPLQSDIIHPKFTEVTDVFEITCRYTVPDVTDVNWDSDEEDVEDMCDEVTRIIKTVYDPQTPTGTFFRSTFQWKNSDDLTQTSQVLKRVLTLTLIKIVSQSTSVYNGFGGVLAFDTSASTGTSKPGTDYTFTEAYRVQHVGGFRQIGELIDQNPNGEHVPVWFTGGYNGRFNCEMALKEEDIGTGTHQIPTIGNPDTFGEVNDVVFLWTSTNTKGTPTTLTNSISMRVISLEPIYDTEDIARIRLIGQITKPPTMVIT